MKTRKKKTTGKKSELSLEEFLQRASLRFTPDDFITVKEESNQKSDTESTIE